MLQMTQCPIDIDSLMRLSVVSYITPEMSSMEGEITLGRSLTADCCTNWLEPLALKDSLAVE